MMVKYQHSDLDFEEARALRIALSRRSPLAQRGSVRISVHSWWCSFKVFRRMTFEGDMATQAANPKTSLSAGGAQTALPKNWRTVVWCSVEVRCD